MVVCIVTVRVHRSGTLYEKKFSVPSGNDGRPYTVNVEAFVRDVLSLACRDGCTDFNGLAMEFNFQEDL